MDVHKNDILSLIIQLLQSESDSDTILWSVYSYLLYKLQFITCKI